MTSVAQGFLSRSGVLLTSIVIFFGAVSCARKAPPAPQVSQSKAIATSSVSTPAPAMVLGIETVAQPALPTAFLAPGVHPSKAVISRVKLDKAQILDRTFLYGSDLQYSSVKDEKFQ